MILLYVCKILKNKWKIKGGRKSAFSCYDYDWINWKVEGGENARRGKKVGKYYKKEFSINLTCYFLLRLVQYESW